MPLVPSKILHYTLHLRPDPSSLCGLSRLTYSVYRLSHTLAWSPHCAKYACRHRHGSFVYLYNLCVQACVHSGLQNKQLKAVHNPQAQLLRIVSSYIYILLQSPSQEDRQEGGEGNANTDEDEGNDANRKPKPGMPAYKAFLVHIAHPIALSVRSLHTN